MKYLPLLTWISALAHTTVVEQFQTAMHHTGIYVLCMDFVLYKINKQNQKKTHFLSPGSSMHTWKKTLQLSLQII